ncbi:prepilin-type N-terminal cleavage/methylation domain-containing protein [Enterobacteriaceae bacterium Kacie_13]|nr:prepilin-type N-terminal cleavage/methylation domain-containing protein [Enterobacteriaceae bacterium Kacie_13]
MSNISPPFREGNFKSCLKGGNQVRKGNSGFSLLEIIIVLALIGMMLVMLANYKKKQIDETSRQITANAIVQEMYGLLKFVNEDEVAMDNSPNTLTNPLYTKDKGSIDSYKNVYYKRVSNAGLLDTMQASDYLSWKGSNSKRAYFTSKSCDGTTADPTKGQVNRNFEVDYIRCKLPNIALVGNMQLERVDLVGSATEALAIDRVDYTVKFVPDRKTDYLYFENFKPAFDKALENYKLTYKQAVVLARPKGSADKDWVVVIVNKAGNKSAIDFGDVANHTGDLANPQGHDYAIRFSFETGIGKYAKSDGSVGVDKQCWNINKRMTGPCIEADDSDHLAIYSGSGSTTNKPGLCWDSKSNKSLPCLSVSEGDSTGTNGDDQTMHLTTEKDNKTVTGTLMANIIVENTGNVDAKGAPELLTVPVVEYRAFGNDFSDAKKDNDYVGNVGSEKGTMKVNVQKCPTAPGGRKMYPRLVAAISSVSADVGEDSDSKESESNFSNLAQNRTSLGAVGRLAGVALQVNLNSETTNWTVSATSALYDNLTGAGINLINSQSVSVVLTSWCSTTKQ